MPKGKVGRRTPTTTRLTRKGGRGKPGVTAMKQTIHRMGVRAQKSNDPEVRRKGRVYLMETPLHGPTKAEQRAKARAKIRAAALRKRGGPRGMKK